MKENIYKENTEVHLSVGMFECKDGICVSVPEKELTEFNKRDIIIQLIETANRMAKRFELDIEEVVSRYNKIVELEKRIALKMAEKEKKREHTRD